MYFTNVKHVHPICPEALHILKLNSIDLELVAVQAKMVVIPGARNELHSVSPKGIFIPVGFPLEGQLAVRTLIYYG